MLIYLFDKYLIGELMGETLVRFEDAQEHIIEKLTALGIFKTRSEAIRAGILELGRFYGVFKNVKELEDELAVRKMSKISKELKTGRRRLLTEKEVKRKYALK